eukprot:Nk52_evm23s1763 gene=Nk52_evmTU23s1763
MVPLPRKKNSRVLVPLIILLVVFAFLLLVCKDVSGEEEEEEDVELLLDSPAAQRVLEALERAYPDQLDEESVVKLEALRKEKEEWDAKREKRRRAKTKSAMAEKEDEQDAKRKYEKNSAVNEEYCSSASSSCPDSDNKEDSSAFNFKVGEEYELDLDLDLAMDKKGRKTLPKTKAKDKFSHLRTKVDNSKMKRPPTETIPGLNDDFKQVKSADDEVDPRLIRLVTNPRGKKLLQPHYPVPSRHEMLRRECERDFYGTPVLPSTGRLMEAMREEFDRNEGFMDSERYWNEQQLRGVNAGYLPGGVYSRGGVYGAEMLRQALKEWAMVFAAANGQCIASHPYTYFLHVDDPEEVGEWVMLSENVEYLTKRLGRSFIDPKNGWLNISAVHYLEAMVESDEEMTKQQLIDSRNDRYHLNDPQFLDDPVFNEELVSALRREVPHSTFYRALYEDRPRTVPKPLTIEEEFMRRMYELPNEEWIETFSGDSSEKRRGAKQHTVSDEANDPILTEMKKEGEKYGIGSSAQDFKALMDEGSSWIRLQEDIDRALIRQRKLNQKAEISLEEGQDAAEKLEELETQKKMSRLPPFFTSHNMRAKGFCDFLSDELHENNMECIGADSPTVRRVCYGPHFPVEWQFACLAAYTVGCKTLRREPVILPTQKHCEYTVERLAYGRLESRDQLHIHNVQKTRKEYDELQATHNTSLPPFDMLVPEFAPLQPTQHEVNEMRILYHRMSTSRLFRLYDQDRKPIVPGMTNEERRKVEKEVTDLMAEGSDTSSSELRKLKFKLDDDLVTRRYYDGMLEKSSLGPNMFVSPRTVAMAFQGFSREFPDFCKYIAGESYSEDALEMVLKTAYGFVPEADMRNDDNKQTVHCKEMLNMCLIAPVSEQRGIEMFDQDILDKSLLCQMMYAQQCEVESFKRDATPFMAPAVLFEYDVPASRLQSLMTVSACPMEVKHMMTRTGRLALQRVAEMMFNEYVDDVNHKGIDEKLALGGYSEEISNFVPERAFVANHWISDPINLEYMLYGTDFCIVFDMIAEYNKLGDQEIIEKGRYSMDDDTLEHGDDKDDEKRTGPLYTKYSSLCTLEGEDAVRQVCMFDLRRSIPELFERENKLGFIKDGNSLRRNMCVSMVRAICNEDGVFSPLRRNERIKDPESHELALRYHPMFRKETIGTLQYEKDRLFGLNNVKLVNPATGQMYSLDEEEVFDNMDEEPLSPDLFTLSANESAKRLTEMESAMSDLEASVQYLEDDLEAYEDINSYNTKILSKLSSIREYVDQALGSTADELPENTLLGDTRNMLEKVNTLKEGTGREEIDVNDSASSSRYVDMKEKIRRALRLQTLLRLFESPLDLIMGDKAELEGVEELKKDEAQQVLRELVKEEMEDKIGSLELKWKREESERNSKKDRDSLAENLKKVGVGMSEAMHDENLVKLTDRVSDEEYKRMLDKMMSTGDIDQSKEQSLQKDKELIDKILNEYMKADDISKNNIEKLLGELLERPSRVKNYDDKSTIKLLDDVNISKEVDDVHKDKNGAPEGRVEGEIGLNDEWPAHFEEETIRKYVKKLRRIYSNAFHDPEVGDDVDGGKLDLSWLQEFEGYMASQAKGRISDPLSNDHVREQSEAIQSARSAVKRKVVLSNADTQFKQDEDNDLGEEFEVKKETAVEEASEDEDEQYDGDESDGGADGLYADEYEDKEELYDDEEEDNEEYYDDESDGDDDELYVDEFEDGDEYRYGAEERNNMMPIVGIDDEELERLYAEQGLKVTTSTECEEGDEDCFL